jgi:CHAT domain-containing protein
MQLDQRDSSRAYAVEAFAVSERQRARSLLDALEESMTDIRRGVAPAVLAREEELRREMNLWSYRLAVFSDRQGREEAAAEARKLLSDRVGEYRRVEAQIRATSQASAAVVGSSPLTLAELQRQVLDPDTALLRFALGTPRSYLWLVTRDSMRTVTLPERSVIDRAARRVHELIGLPPRTGADDQQPLQAAVRELSALLLAPLGSRPAAQRLLIVPEGSLQLIPFVVLPEPGGESPLIRRYEIVTLPSATTLAVLRRQVAGRPPAVRPLAVVADPVYDPRDPRIGQRASTGQGALSRSARPALGEGEGFSLERLRFSQLEATSIAGLVSSSSTLMATGFAASRDTVLSAAMRDFRILHLAVHALLDDDHPEVSGIALSLFDEQGRTQDGFLRVHEIREHLALRSDLVVVSACETALGRDVPGEGLMGLARAFFTAGAARVVATVFSVSDAATAQLMREFYRGMFGPARLSPAAALRQAQLRMLDEPRWRHPFYWSGFVLLGEPR